MRGRQLASIGLALAFCALGQAVGYTQDEQGGQVLNFQTNVGTGHNCGRVSTPLYCYGIPVNIGTGSGGNGSFWLDTYLTGYNMNTGFVAFNGVADLGEGHVIKDVATYNNSGQVTSLVVMFNGTTNDGDNGTYSGAMSLTFTYYYSPGGGGRGGGGGGWYFVCTGGTVKITYQ